MSTPVTSATEAQWALDEILEGEAVESAFQPIVDLETGEVVAYEALVRGPAGNLHSPAALFAAAAEAGRTGELDWLARANAYREFLAAGAPEGLTLFVNVEPEALSFPCPTHLQQVVEEAAGRLRVVVELTERSLVEQPTEVLAAVQEARRRGWGVALDDVGAVPESLALLPFVEPEVIKLDLRLIQNRTDTDVAEIVEAVRAEAERTGATILAEGIEVEEHVHTAVAAGATLGQGWLLGRPGPLPAVLKAPLNPIPFPERSVPEGVTPFGIVAQHRKVRRISKALSLSTSHHIENLVHTAGMGAVVLGCFQDAKHFTPFTRERYAALAEEATLTAALGIGMGPAPLPGVRGADLNADHPLAGEWVVVVVGPHVAAAFVGKDCGDTGPERERRFDCVTTYDRALVLKVARNLLNVIVPPSIQIPAQR